MDEEIERTHPFSLIFNKNGKTGLIPPFCQRGIDINPCVKKVPPCPWQGGFPLLSIILYGRKLVNIKSTATPNHLGWRLIL
ncbi:MAG: hypothetical protein IKK30_02170 [Clostridia bacterium]|nr:hypothetical protein [Clostridia bacterium]